MAQTSPTVSAVHVNRPLTDMSVAYIQDAADFVSQRAMPRYLSNHRSDTYYVYSKGDAYRDEARVRMPGTSPAIGSHDLTQATFNCTVYDIAEVIADEERSNADAVLNLDDDALGHVIQWHMIRRERDFVNAYMTAGNFTDWTGVANADNDTAIEFTKFSDLTNGDPIREFRRAATAIKASTGFRGNYAVISRDVWDTIVEHPNVLDRITGGSTSGDPAIVTRQNFAAACELDEVLIIDSVYNSANDNAGAVDNSVVQFTTSGTALVYYRPRVDVVSRKTRCAGISFNWSGLLGAGNEFGTAIKRYYVEKESATYVEGWSAFDHHVVDADMGVLMSAAL
jgi:hypothetical protein